MTALQLSDSELVKDDLLCIVDIDSIVGLIELARHETAFNLQTLLFPSAADQSLNTH